MWKVFPKLGLLKLLFLIFSALFLSALIIVFSSSQEDTFTWSNFGVALELATPVTLLFIAFIYILGKWGWLLLWEAPFLGRIMHKTICPNLNGEWLGEIQSNFEDSDSNHVIKKVVLRIKADIFGFDVKLKSQDGYQESKVTQSELYKDPRTNTFYLSYIFEANVPFPEDTDDRLFEGAAKLEIIVNSEDTVMKGTYWTNRAFQRGKNTAGVIAISRSNS